MKILIVDDKPDRVATLVSYLSANTECEPSGIEVAVDGLSARDALMKDVYDLLILDVVLPFRSGEEPTEQTAVGLLTELTDTENLTRPRHIIGLTAYEAAEWAVASEFRSRAWVLVRENSLNDDWLQTIGSAVRYIMGQEQREDDRDHLIDVVIITALQVEMEAVRRLPWNWTPDIALDDSQFFSQGTFLSGGQERSVVAAVSGRMGMVSAAILASKLIKRFRPRLIAMPGICAGVRDKAKLGDVICADMSWDYQSGKHVSTQNALNGFLMDPHFIPADAFVSARVAQLSNDEAVSLSVWRGWHPKRDAPPKLLRGPVASGSAVLADRQFTESIRLQQRKLLAVEMELYGVFFAAEQAPRPKPVALGMKSVCDFADEEKSDELQSYAAYTSACYLQEFCERYVADF